MGKLFLLLFGVFAAQVLHAQIKENIHGLNPLDNLLTDEVKNIVQSNIADKPTVFLGEAVHYSGSDLLAKAEL